MSKYPTSADIYLELDGKKVAIVQGYSASTQKQSRVVEAFGEDEPVATIAGQAKHSLELSRLYITDDAMKDGLDFHSLSDFSLVIVKPDRKIIYTGCNWSSISEKATLGQMVTENVSITAAKRLETAV
ncbi:hypothetical protein LJC32_04935 [Oscillospiraceae bacterium OttesenSCG-928-F05]|nr:hypothetical protein [Oscillospiraceae bacterium OttesenSCG-928-F05]